jgi:hypothetical protein
MKNWHLLSFFLLALLPSGCESLKKEAYYTQPPLHKPVITDYTGLVLSSNDSFNVYYKTYDTVSQISTNAGSAVSATNGVVQHTYPYLCAVHTNHLTEYPPVSSLEFITNRNDGSIYPIAGPIIEANNEYKDAPGYIKCSFQIESEEDMANEFGRIFSSCFYVGRINIHNDSTNLTFLADSSSLWVMTSFYLRKQDWEGNPVLQENVKRRYDGEYIRMPRHPLTYKDILAVFQFEQKADPRQQLSDYLDSAGVIASGVSVFVPGALYAHGVNFAIGIIKPEIQKHLLWDLTMYQANFMARSLPETVKVGPNLGVDGLVFFPRRGIPGYVDEYNVYISSFNSKQTAQVIGAMVSENNAASSALLSTLNTTPASTTTNAPVQH